MAPICMEVYLIFNICFFIFAREFESIKTSSGFASLLESPNRFMMVENKLLNDESLELNIVISRKNLQVSTHCIKSLKVNEKSQN